MADSYSYRGRGQEITLFVTVNGVALAGSFTKIVSISLKQRADISNTGFMGEAEDEPDIMHHGWDVNFTNHVQDDSGFSQLVFPLIQGATSSSPQTPNSPVSSAIPTVQVGFIVKFRDPKIPVLTLTCQAVKIKLDEWGASDRKAYQGMTWSGSCRTVVPS